MALSDLVTTTRENIISMVACAEDYGHDNQITRAFFWDLLGHVLTDGEISDYAEKISSMEGYGEEDAEEIVERLQNWRHITTPRPETEGEG